MENNKIDKILRNFIKTTLKEFLNENKKEIIDYSKSRNIISVGSKTNLIPNMKERYDFSTNNNEIYFFDNGYHFATLYNVGRFIELKHDGTLDEYGWRKFKKRPQK